MIDQQVTEGSEPTVPGPPVPAAGPGRRAKWLLVGGAVVASMMAGGLAFSLFGPSSPAPVVPPVATSDAHTAHHGLQVKTRPITRAELARKYGIRLTLVGVTASGGLVDLRFRITDAAKAKKLFTKPSVVPAVIQERTGTVIQAHASHHNQVVPKTGGSYFILMGNAGGVVQRGVPVTVVFNTVRVEHIVAET